MQELLCGLPILEGLQTLQPKFPEEKGLENNIGENNCFLNVVIQSLWHLEEFKRRFTFAVKQKHIHQDPCGYCSLELIFTHYQYSSMEHLPPTALRQTMAILFRPTAQFQLFQIDDASEAFEAVLTCLHQQLSSRSPSELHACSQDCIAHSVFGISTVEELSCPGCNKDYRGASLNLYTVYSYVAALRAIYEQEPDLNFSKILKRASEGDFRCCPTESCMRVCTVSHILTSFPPAFAVNLAWDSPQPTLGEIRTMFKMLSPTLDLSDIFKIPSHLGETAPKYRLKGMICYYGKHYNAYFYNESRKIWFLFDDETVKPVGKLWEEVVDRCLRGRLQPSIVFFERDPFYFASSSLLLPQPIKVEKLEPSVPLPSPLSSPPPSPFSSPPSSPTASSTSPPPTSPLSSSPSSPTSSTSSLPDLHSPGSPPPPEEHKQDIKEEEKVGIEEIKKEPVVLVEEKTEQKAVEQKEEEKEKKEEEEDEIFKSFILIESEENEEENNEEKQSETKPKAEEEIPDIDFAVQRTNWLYRRQGRMYRLSLDKWMRLLPYNAHIQETFTYPDIFDITSTDPTNIIIRFYSGREAQYISSPDIGTFISTLQKRAARLGHSFPVKSL